MAKWGPVKKDTFAPVNSGSHKRAPLAPSRAVIAAFLQIRDKLQYQVVNERLRSSFRSYKHDMLIRKIREQALLLNMGVEPYLREIGVTEQPND